MYELIRDNKEDITTEILAECNEFDMNDKEEYYIDKYKPKYNYIGVDVPYKGQAHKQDKGAW